MHLKFDIQGVNNIVNLAPENQAMWLVNIWALLVSNLEEAKKSYKKNVGEHHKNQPNFKVRNQTWLWRKNIKTIWPLEKLNYQIYIRSIHHHETNQCHVLPIQTFGFHENSSCVSCFFCWNLIMHLPSQERFMNHPHLWNLLLNNMKWRMSSLNGIKLTTLIPHSLAWIWCKQTHLGTN